MIKMLIVRCSDVMTGCPKLSMAIKCCNRVEGMEIGYWILELRQDLTLPGLSAFAFKQSTFLGNLPFRLSTFNLGYLPLPFFPLCTSIAYYVLTPPCANLFFFLHHQVTTCSPGT